MNSKSNICLDPAMQSFAICKTSNVCEPLEELELRGLPGGESGYNVPKETGLWRMWWVLGAYAGALHISILQHFVFLLLSLMKYSRRFP